MGLEPTISTLTGWRALQAAPRGRIVELVAQVGVEPGTDQLWMAGLVLLVQSQASLPTATIPHRSQSTMPTTSSCGGRNRTCVRAINSRLPVPAQDPPHHGVWCSVRTVGLEPTISCAQSTRNTRLSHVLNPRAPSGSRTHTSAMARQ